MPRSWPLQAETISASCWLRSKSAALAARPLAREIGLLLFQYTRSFQIMPMQTFPRAPSAKVRRHEIEAIFRQRQALDTRPQA